MIHLHLELRRIVERIGAHPDQALVLRRHAEHLVARGEQSGVPDPGLVDELKIEAGGVAEFLHGGRHDGEDHRVLELRQGTHRTARDRLRLVLGARSIPPMP